MTASYQRNILFATFKTFYYFFVSHFPIAMAPGQQQMIFRWRDKPALYTGVRKSHRWDNFSKYAAHPLWRHTHSWESKVCSEGTSDMFLMFYCSYRGHEPRIMNQIKAGRYLAAKSGRCFSYWSWNDCGHRSWPGQTCGNNLRRGQVAHTCRYVYRI